MSVICSATGVVDCILIDASTEVRCDFDSLVHSVLEPTFQLNTIADFDLTIISFEGFPGQLYGVPQRS